MSQSGSSNASATEMYTQNHAAKPQVRDLAWVTPVCVMRLRQHAPQSSSACHCVDSDRAPWRADGRPLLEDIGLWRELQEDTRAVSSRADTVGSAKRLSIQRNRAYLDRCDVRAFLSATPHINPQNRQKRTYRHPCQAGPGSSEHATHINYHTVKDAKVDDAKNNNPLSRTLAIERKGLDVA